jgi:integrase/recombinase XerD
VYYRLSVGVTKLERRATLTYVMGALVPQSVAITDVLSVVENSVSSQHSRRAYRTAIIDFLCWYRLVGAAGFSRSVVQQYRSELLSRRLAPSSINIRLCAIRKLALEMADNGWLPRDVAGLIERVKGVRRAGIRSGNWLAVTQAEALLNAPSPSSLRGKRDRALLGVLLGAGLRRAEAATLAFTHIQEREGRWVLADLVGKRGRVRTVPIAGWTKALIDKWREASGLTGGRVFRPLDKAGRITAAELTPQTIFHIVRAYGSAVGVSVAPHDLRRTFARLAHKGRASLDQIQLRKAGTKAAWSMPSRPPMAAIGRMVLPAASRVCWIPWLGTWRP